MFSFNNIDKHEIALILSASYHSYILIFYRVKKACILQTEWCGKIIIDNINHHSGLSEIQGVPLP